MFFVLECRKAWWRIWLVRHCIFLSIASSLFTKTCLLAHSIISPCQTHILPSIYMFSSIINVWVLKYEKRSHRTLLRMNAFVNHLDIFPVFASDRILISFACAHLPSWPKPAQGHSRPSGIETSLIIHMIYGIKTKAWFPVPLTYLKHCLMASCRI